MRVVLVLLIAGCSSQTLPSGHCSVDQIAGAVPGVTLTIEADSCVASRGDGLTFTYSVATASVPALLSPDSQGQCGSCQPRSADPLSWVSWSLGGTSNDGNAQGYCLCDVGCCAPDVEQTITLDDGVKSATLAWAGRTWSGPSDTGNPMGDFFEPGLYAMTVTFAGGAAGNVTAALSFEVTP